jgi:hypothetical protein
MDDKGKLKRKPLLIVDDYNNENYSTKKKKY